ncbi:MAG TPA: hypothetical protein VHA13_02785, partial [Gammaproteobacteria bacterium]|nr:hypothetical protein [Gammaproteobacteria bacterium]
KSDIEFALLAEKELTGAQKPYFDGLMNLVRTFIYCLGETENDYLGFRLDSAPVECVTPERLCQELSHKLYLKNYKAGYFDSWYMLFSATANQSFSELLSSPGYSSCENNDLFERYQQNIRALLNSHPDINSELTCRQILFRGFSCYLAKNLPGDSLKSLYRNRLCYPMLLMSLLYDCPEKHPQEIAKWLKRQKILSPSFTHHFIRAYRQIQQQRLLCHQKECALNEEVSETDRDKFALWEDRLITPLYDWLKSENVLMPKLELFDPLLFLWPQYLAQYHLEKPKLATAWGKVLRSLAFALADKPYSEILSYYQDLPLDAQSFFLKHFHSHDQRRAVLLKLSRHPKTNGQRAAEKIADNGWQKVLTKLTTDLDETKGQLILQWVNLKGESVKRCLNPKFASSWRKLNWLDHEGGFQEMARNHTDGRSIVLPLNDLAFIKIFPELPGRQLLIQALAWRLSGYGPVSTLAKLEVAGTDKVYPVLLSQNLGISIQEHLRRQPLADLESKLNTYAFTLKILESILLSYEDDKPDNISVAKYRDPDSPAQSSLISFDCDRGFAEAILKRESLFKTEIKVNTKSLIYCMPQMESALHPDAIKEFLALDPFQVLNDWLEQQRRYQELIFNLKDQGCLFKREHVLTWLATNKDDCSIPAALELGSIKTLYLKWLRLRAVLSSTEAPSNHLQLLSRMEPVLASYYESSFVNHNNTLTRFHSLPTDYVTIEEKIAEQNSDCILASKQSTLIKYQTTGIVRHRMLRSITISKEKKDIKQAILQGEIHLPHSALGELKHIHQQCQSINQIIEQIKQNNLEPLKNLGEAAYLKEQVLRNLDFSDLAIEQQKRILKLIIGGDFLEFQLRNCAITNPSILTDCLTHMPGLLNLTLFNNKGISKDIPTFLANKLPHLQKLSISRSNIHAFIKPTIFGSPSLLAFQGLRTLMLLDIKQLKIINIHAPHLQQLSVSGCDSIEEIATESKFLEHVDISVCRSLCDIKLDNLCADFTSIKHIFLHRDIKAELRDFWQQYPWLFGLSRFPHGSLAFTANLMKRLAEKLDSLITSKQKTDFRMRLQKELQYRMLTIGEIKDYSKYLYNNIFSETKIVHRNYYHSEITFNLDERLINQIYHVLRLMKTCRLEAPISIKGYELDIIFFNIGDLNGLRGACTDASSFNKSTKNYTSILVVGTE